MNRILTTLSALSTLSLLALGTAAQVAHATQTDDRGCSIQADRIRAELDEVIEGFQDLKPVVAEHARAFLKAAGAIEGAPPSDEPLSETELEQLGSCGGSLARLRYRHRQSMQEFETSVRMAELEQRLVAASRLHYTMSQLPACQGHAMIEQLFGGIATVHARVAEAKSPMLLLERCTDPEAVSRERLDAALEGGEALINFFRLNILSR